jgi:hypothetical protein
VPAVDPQQTTLPEEWRHLPAYAVVQESAMTLSEKRRGDADPAPDELALDRTLWLDFAGTGYTFRDRISGRLSRSWRLDMPLPPMGRVSVDGVTSRSAASARTGPVSSCQGEPRSRPMALRRPLARASCGRLGPRPASVAATLQLPPAGALPRDGVDRSPRRSALLDAARSVPGAQIASTRACAARLGRVAVSRSR